MGDVLKQCEKTKDHQSGQMLAARIVVLHYIQSISLCMQFCLVPAHIDTLKCTMEYMPKITDMYSLFLHKLYISTLLSHPQKVEYDLNIYVLLEYNISFSLLGGM